MIIIKDTEILKEKEIAATIGFFDGVHLGHRFLIGELMQIAQTRNLPSAVITFSQHPRAILQSDYQPKLLNSFEEKLDHLASTGIDYCIVLNFTLELSRLSAQEFIRSILAEKLHVKTLLIGYDHRFGHNRKEGFEQYVNYGKQDDIDVLKATPYDMGKTHVSSSEIRTKIISGHVKEAAYLLSYAYQLEGHIISGHKIGRTLGFPTANIQVDDPLKIIPGIGVYAVWVNVEGNKYKGMLYIGNRPTLKNGDNISMEVNIFNFDSNIYNDKIIVTFIAHIRDDIQFDSLDQLREQLAKDRETVATLLE